MILRRILVIFTLFFSSFAISQQYSKTMYENLSSYKSEEVINDGFDQSVSSPAVNDTRKITEGEKIRNAVSSVIVRFDKIGLGNFAQQCFDASRIVQIAENPNGWRELVFLMSGLIALIISLFVTKVLASMFNVEVAKLIWIPIGACVAMLIGVYMALKTAEKHKKIAAGAIALSTIGVVSIIGPIRQAFFDFTAWVFIWFAGWYVPLCSFATGLGILIFVFSILGKHLDGGFGSIGSIILRNAIGIIVIPFVCAFVFLGIISVFGPWFDANIGSFS